jgi:hypothetical protein
MFSACGGQPCGEQCANVEPPLFRTAKTLSDLGKSIPNAGTVCIPAAWLSMSAHQADIETLLRLAAQYEATAELTKDPAERANNLWLAARMREKAAWLLRQPD